MLSRLFVEPFQLPFMRRALLEVVLLGAFAGGVGVLVVLRRLAFLADALTHTVFPGVVVGYLVGQEGGIVHGALLLGVLSAVLFTLLAARARVSEDAALAVLLTAFFSVGVVLVSRRTSYTSDLTAFLFGRLLTVDRVDVVRTAVVAAVVFAVIAALRKELVLHAFDPGAARAMGYRVVVLDLVLNLLVTLVVVAAVKAVGTVLVIALLVLPAATARLLSDKLAVLSALAVLLGGLGGGVGLAASYEASMHHGVRLASGATVVLTLVGFYLLGLAAVVVGRQAGRRRHHRPPAEAADLAETARTRLPWGAR